MVSELSPVLMFLFKAMTLREEHECMSVSVFFKSFLYYLILCMFISTHQSSSYSTDYSSSLFNTKLCTISLKCLIPVPPAHFNTVSVKTLRMSLQLVFLSGLLLWLHKFPLTHLSLCSHRDLCETKIRSRECHLKYSLPPYFQQNIALPLKGSVYEAFFILPYIIKR